MNEWTQEVKFASTWMVVQAMAFHRQFDQIINDRSGGTLPGACTSFLASPLGDQVQHGRHPRRAAS